MSETNPSPWPSPHSCLAGRGNYIHGVRTVCQRGDRSARLTVLFASTATNAARLLPLLHSEWRRGSGRGGSLLPTTSNCHNLSV